MFRGSTPSEISPKNFGAGSTVHAGEQESYLVVKIRGGFIGLVSLQTFAMVGDSIEVQDEYYLSEAEARKLVGTIDYQSTFSDFELRARGLKESKLK